MKAEPMLTHVKLRERVIQIGDSVGNACTLVLGDRKALLFDTMSGTCDLAGYVRTLTDLPLMVVLSHGHFDHVFGSWQFPEIYMNPLEKTVYDRNWEFLEEILVNTGSVLPRELIDRSFTVHFTDLTDGDVFDLGGITAEAVSLPGHTLGSTGLLLREERILLVGDAISPQMTLLFEESCSIDTYLQTLSKAKALPIDALIGSHFLKTFPLQAIDIFAECAGCIGSVRGIKYVFTPVPRYKGILWFYKINDPVTDEPVCIITKEEL